MKKIFYLAIALTVLFAACKKEQSESIDKKIVMSGMSEIEPKIIDFLEKIDEPAIDSLPVNDAVFFLEAGFNYRYAHAGNDLEMTTTRIDTSYVNLQVVESYSTYTNLKTAFDDIYDEMSTVFDAIEDEEKALSIIQITLEDDNTLRVISVWRHSASPFGGDWLWGWKFGKCDNTRIGRDATDAIRFSHTIYFSNPLPYGLWTNVSFSHIYFANDNLMDYLDDPNPYGYDDKLLFKHIQYTQHVTHCMAEVENLYYAELLPTAISRIKNNEGITNYFMNVFFVCKQDLIQQNPVQYSIEHGIQLMHGDWVSTNNIPWDDFSTI